MNRKPRRIAHVVSTPSGLGGAEVVLLALVKGGAARGWDQIVVNPFDETPGTSALAEELGPLYRARRTTSLLEIGKARRYLIDELKAFHPEVMHAHLFHALVLASTLPRNLYLTSVLSHQHGNHLVVQGQRLRERADRWAGARYDRVVACSEWVRTFLLKRYRYPAEKVVRIRNGWEGDPVPSRGGDGRTIVTIANFRRQKDHDSLVRAFAKVRERVPDCKLVLVGEGPLRGAIEQLVGTLGLTGSVTFAGAVPSVWGHLEQATVFALPSLYEPLGIAVLEAMAAGVPVVASSVGGIPELVQPGRTGLLVPPGDVDALAAALIEVVTSPNREGMGSAARAVADNFKMDQMVDDYFSLYDDLLSSHVSG